MTASLSNYAPYMAEIRARGVKREPLADIRAYADLNRNYRALLAAIVARIPVSEAVRRVAKDPEEQKDSYEFPNGWDSKHSAEQIEQWEAEYVELGDWKLVAKRDGRSQKTIYGTVYRYRRFLQGR